MIALYFGGIVMGILMALLLRHTMFSGEAVPFVMELPNYRLPGAKNVGHLLWDKAKDFLQRAFTVIFMATLVIWFLQTFDLHLTQVTDSQNSILAHVAGVIGADLQAHGLRRLADLHSTDYGLPGQGERGIYPVHPVWRNRSVTECPDSAGSSKPFDLLPALYSPVWQPLLPLSGSLAENGPWQL